MEPEKKSNGAFIGLVIIIIILIIGGIYIWQSKMQKTLEQNKNISSDGFSDTDYTDLGALEKDLGSANVSTGVDINSVQ